MTTLTLTHQCRPFATLNGGPVVDVRTYVPDADYDRVHAWRQASWREQHGYGYGDTPPAPDDIAALLAAWIDSARAYAGTVGRPWYQSITPEREARIGYVRLWTVRPLSTLDAPTYQLGCFMIGPHGQRHREDGPILYTFSG